MARVATKWRRVAAAAAAGGYCNSRRLEFPRYLWCGRPARLGGGHEKWREAQDQRKKVARGMIRGVKWGRRSSRRRSIPLMATCARTLVDLLAVSFAALLCWVVGGASGAALAQNEDAR